MHHKPFIYFAGKIAPHDWREQIVGRDIELGYDEENIFNPQYIVPLSAFNYCGPFYVRCDHCCAHGTANHGAGATGDKAGCISNFFGNEISTPVRVFEINRRRIKNADIVFAYINETSCHGTLIELGMAAEQGKAIAVVFGPDLSPC